MRLFYLQLRSFCLRFVFFTSGGGTVSKKDQIQFPDRGNRKQKRPNLISGQGGTVSKKDQTLSGAPVLVTQSRYSYSYSYSLSLYVFQVSHPIALYPPKLGYRKCCPVSKAVTASRTRRPMTLLHSHTQVACRGGNQAGLAGRFSRDYSALGVQEAQGKHFSGRL